MKWNIVQFVIIYSMTTSRDGMDEEMNQTSLFVYIHVRWGSFQPSHMDFKIQRGWVDQSLTHSIYGVLSFS